MSLNWTVLIILTHHNATECVAEEWYLLFMYACPSVVIYNHSVISYVDESCSQNFGDN